MRLFHEVPPFLSSPLTQAHDFQVWSLFLWLSGEVKHIVHLIRWNLKAVLCQLGQDLTTVPVQGTIARHLGILGLNPVLIFCGFIN